MFRRLKNVAVNRSPSSALRQTPPPPPQTSAETWPSADDSSVWTPCVRCCLTVSGQIAAAVLHVSVWPT